MPMILNPDCMQAHSQQVLEQLLVAVAKDQHAEVLPSLVTKLGSIVAVQLWRHTEACLCCADVRSSVAGSQLMHQIEPATPPASFQREESGAGAAQQTTIAWEGYPQVSLTSSCASDCGIWCCLCTGSSVACAAVCPNLEPEKLGISSQRAILQCDAICA